MSDAEVRKAEEALIAAVGRWREARRPMDQTPWPGVIASHYDALVALRAPPKPMSAEERWASLGCTFGFSANMNAVTRERFVAEIREAESEAWNRAVDAQCSADADVIGWYQAALPMRLQTDLDAYRRGVIGNLALLTGKCHEVQP